MNKKISMKKIIKVFLALFKDSYSKKIDVYKYLDYNEGIVWSLRINQNQFSKIKIGKEFSIKFHFSNKNIEYKLNKSFI